MTLLLQLKEGKSENERKKEPVAMEKFSLDLQEIQPSTAFGTRGRNALRGEGFAWVPDLGEFFQTP